MKTFKKSTKLILSIITVCILLTIAHQYVSFVNPRFEDWFQFIVSVVIAISVITYVSLNFKKVYSIALLVIFIPIFLFYLFLVVLFLDSGYLTEKQSIPFGSFNLVVYQTNCGATCSYGVLIRVEKKFFFDTVQTTSNFRSYYKAMDIKLEKVGDDSVRVISTDFYPDNERESYGKKPEIGEVWKVR